MKIKVFAFPYDPISVQEVDGWLGELETQKLIERYEMEGVKVISITGFHKHQNPHSKEVPSTLPCRLPQDEVNTPKFESPVLAPDFSATSCEKAPDKHQTFSHSSCDNSGLIPDSLIPSSPIPPPMAFAIGSPPPPDAVGESHSANGTETGKPNKPNPQKRNAGSAVQRDWFDAWWTEVWRRVDKGAAERVFFREVRTKETFDAVLAATKLQAPELRGREVRYQPYPATWLNGKRWLDEAPADRSQPPRKALCGKCGDLGHIPDLSRITEDSTMEEIQAVPHVACSCVCGEEWARRMRDGPSATAALSGLFANLESEK